MIKLYCSFVAVFTTKISPLLGFGVICFLGISISSLIVFSYSDPATLFPGIQAVDADIIMPPIQVPPKATAEPQQAAAEKIIYVSLKDQTLAYLEGSKIIGEFKISSGLPGTPTPPGEYSVLKKKPTVDYTGATYSFLDTKWNLMFKTGPLNYYIHGAFWHHNFGHPMSHGCVNVSYADMEGLYNWAGEGTKIIIQQEPLDNLALTNSNIYPTPTGEVIASRVTDSSAALSWNAATDPAGVAGYQIYQNNFLIATTTLPKFEISGLTANTSYRFSVYAYDQSGNNSFQAEGVNVLTSKKIGVGPGLVPNPSPAPSSTPLSISGPKPNRFAALLPAINRKLSWKI